MNRDATRALASGGAREQCSSPKTSRHLTGQRAGQRKLPLLSSKAGGLAPPVQSSGLAQSHKDFAPKGERSTEMDPNKSRIVSAVLSENQRTQEECCAVLRCYARAHHARRVRHGPASSQLSLLLRQTPACARAAQILDPPPAAGVALYRSLRSPLAPAALARAHRTRWSVGLVRVAAVRRTSRLLSRFRRDAWQLYEHCSAVCEPPRGAARCSCHGDC